MGASMMKCDESKSLLSAYHDQELSPIKSSQLSEHLEGCADCRAELNIIQQISTLVEPIRSSTIVPVNWSLISEQLSPTPCNTKTHRYSLISKRRLLWSIAAVFLVAVIYAVASNRGGKHEHNEMANHLQAFSAEFTHDPEQAQQKLLSHYKGQKISLTEASRKLKYKPVIASGLPTGYVIKENYLLEMPCCLCLQTICERPDGSQFVILEHAKEQSIWPSNLASVKTQCQGYPTTMTDVDGTLAVTCEMSTRNLTMIAAKSIDEATNLIGQFAKSD
jgi:hypothetical protein